VFTISKFCCDVPTETPYIIRDSNKKAALIDNKKIGWYFIIVILLSVKD